MENVNEVIKEAREHQRELQQLFPNASEEEIEKMVRQFIATFYDYRRYYYYKEDKKMKIQDAYFCPYEMAKDFYLDGLVDEGLSKDVAERLTLKVNEILIGNFSDPDECVRIEFNIFGNDEDLALVDEILQVRYSE